MFTGVQRVLSIFELCGVEPVFGGVWCRQLQATPSLSFGRCLAGPSGGNLGQPPFSLRSASASTDG